MKKHTKKTQKSIPTSKGPVNETEERTQLQGTRETRRNRDGALSNSLEGKQMNWSRCENVRPVATKDCRSERQNQKEVLGGFISLPYLVFDVAKSENRRKI